MKILAIIWFVLIPIGIFAQGKVTVSKSDILIGEPTTIYYEVINFKSNAQLIHNPWRKVIKCPTSGTDSIPKELEILIFRDTTIRENQGEWIGAYTITAWDTGVYIVPPHSISIDDEKIDFESIEIRIFLPQLSADDQIVESELPFQDYETDTYYSLKKYLPWIIGGLVLLILGIWFFIKRKKKKQILVEQALNLLERTIQKINDLESKNWIEQQKIKELYIESSFIFRNYLGEQFRLNILEKTSSQTRILLISKGLPADLISDIEILFNLFDSVKFAKFDPEITESAEILNRVKTTVLKINNWTEKNA